MVGAGRMGLVGYLLSNFVQQLAARHLAEQAGYAARSQNETYVCLRPFLIGQISSNVGAEAG